MILKLEKIQSFALSQVGSTYNLQKTGEFLNASHTVGFMALDMYDCECSWVVNSYGNEMKVAISGLLYNLTSLPDKLKISFDDLHLTLVGDSSIFQRWKDHDK